ncbi:MAG: MFS transporter, partial [Prochlorococcus sp.]
MSDHDRDTTSILSGSNLNNPEPTLPTGANPEGRRGLQAVIKLDGFRRLWIGQIFSQLADKFYIVLMVYLIAQYWVSSTPQSNDALAEIAAAIRMDFETRAQRITLLATGIY